MPQSVSARALYAYALAAASQRTASERVAAEAAALPSQTPEDRLLLGHALGYLNPADGLPLMDQALDERSSGIGHVLRANVREHLAKYTGTVADAEVVLVDAELAKRLLPNNSFSLSVALEAHLVAAVAYRKAKRPEKWDEHFAAAKREFDALAKFPKNYWAVQARHDFARVRDGLQPRADMLAELRQTRTDAPGTAITFHEAYDLFCLGRDEEAEELVNDIRNDLLSGIIRLSIALGRPNGRADARKVGQAMASSPSRRIDFFYVAPQLFAVGAPEDVAAFLRDARTIEPLQYGPWNRADQTALLSFLEGTLSESDFLKRPIGNEVERSWRHYTVAWKRLGTGDRAGAKAAFEETYEVMSYEGASWWIARAMLIRMKDPDWLRAIPKK